MGNVGSWVEDPNNWLDVLCIALVFYFSSVMLTGEANMGNDFFRSGAAITKGILWISVISYLKSVQVEFSVFVSGVIFVVQSLATFLMAMAVILLMFAQMYWIIYTDSEHCSCGLDHPDANQYPHCTFMDSLLKVYTMMMGSIGNEMRYAREPLAEMMYLAFTFLVILLLANVLIAIVTDSYSVIKNERSAMVFWSNRLDFVAEMDAYKDLLKILRCKGDSSSEPNADDDRVVDQTQKEYMPTF